jgi:Sec-independent protein translocase protein TatA
MEILGIGPLELLFILLIALIILGPGDMVKAGKTIGRFLRRIITSPEWRTIQKASRELKYLPNRFMREAGMDDLSKELGDINKIGGEISNEVKKVENDLSSWTSPPDPNSYVIKDTTPEIPPSEISHPPADPDTSDGNP